MHTADTLIADEERKKIKKEKVRAALRICGYAECDPKEGELRGKRYLRMEEEKQKGVDQKEGEKRKHATDHCAASALKH